MKRFLLLLIPVLFLAGCSSKEDTDYKAEAEEHYKKGNVIEAINTYEELVKQFPESKLAPEAIERIAGYYNNGEVKGISPEETMLKAAQNFRRLYDTYPNYHRAPYALFMSGYIQANALNKYDEATETFNLFLSKYPNDKDFADDAKNELDNMGLTPEQILEKNTKKLSEK